MFKQTKNGHLLVVMVAVWGWTVPAMADRPADLRKAAREGDLATVQAFIAKGADVNAKDNEGGTALMAASKNGRGEVVQALIAADADINAEDNNGVTALMLASTADVVQALIAAGADVNAKDYPKDDESRTVLMWASKNGRREVVQALIAGGANVNAQNEKGRTALMGASTAEVLQALLAKGANVNAKDNTGWTALMWATLNGRPEVVQALIAGGADVNAKDNEGATVLGYALTFMKAQALLTNIGVDVKAAGFDIKMMQGQREVVNILKRAGARE